MTDYKSCTEKRQLSPRMEKVREDILTRLKPRDIRGGTCTAEVGTDGKNPFLDVFEEIPDAPYVICLAHSIVRSWMVTPFIIHRDEAIVGTTRPFYPFIEHFSWGIINNGFIIEKVTDDYDEMARLEKVISRMTPLPSDHRNRAAGILLGDRKKEVLYNDAMFYAGGYQGHTVPNYYTLLNNGFDGILAKIDRYAAVNAGDEKTADFYEACRIIIRGMSSYLETYQPKPRNYMKPRPILHKNSTINRSRKTADS